MVTSVSIEVDLLVSDRRFSEAGTPAASIYSAVGPPVRTLASPREAVTDSASAEHLLGDRPALWKFAGQGCLLLAGVDQASAGGLDTKAPLGLQQAVPSD